MAFLLFLVSLVFSLIFVYTPSVGVSITSFLGLSYNNIFPILFLCMGGIFFLYFFFIVGKDKKKKNNIDLQKARQAIGRFFQNNLYYIGFILLYIALYFIIGPSVGYNFSYFIFIVSFVILFAFFLTERFSLFRDLIKINTILFSLYYISFYIISFIGGENPFGILDLLNQIFILAFFILNIYNDKTLLKNKINDNALIGYGFVYLLLFLIFYISQGGLSLWLGFVYIGAIMSFVLKNIMTEVVFFHGNEYIIKILSVLFGYIALICSLFYFSIYGFNLFALVLALYLIIDNIIIHNYFQNYLGFVLSLISIGFYYFYFYFHVLSSYEIDGYIFLFYGYLLYFSAVTLGYIQRFKYDQDYYFMYGFFYAASTISMLYFLFTFSFELFDFGVMLLLQSILTFMVYYKFNAIKKDDQDNLPKGL